MHFHERVTVDFVLHTLAPMLTFPDILSFRSCCKRLKYSEWTLKAIEFGRWLCPLQTTTTSYFGLPQTVFLQHVKNIYIQEEDNYPRQNFRRVEWPFVTRGDFSYSEKQITLNKNIIEFDMGSKDASWFLQNGPLVLPNTLQRLRLAKNHLFKLESGMLPINLQVLDLNKTYNYPLEIGILPASLTHLRFGYLYNCPLKIGVLPPLLQYLHMGYKYNHPILPNMLPSLLQTLVLSRFFSHCLLPDVLPSSLRTVVVGFYYPHPLYAGVLPEGLLSLRMTGWGPECDQKQTKSILPSSLQILLLHDNIFRLSDHFDTTHCPHVKIYDMSDYSSDELVYLDVIKTIRYFLPNCMKYQDEAYEAYTNDFSQPKTKILLRERKKKKTITMTTK